MLLHEYLSRAARSRGEATALVFGEERVSYGSLEEESGQIARVLAEHGAAPGERVVLCTPKTPLAIAAMLGALKAGCPYVPIDVESPAARVKLILEAAEASVVLASPEAGGLLDALAADGAIGAAAVVGTLGDGPIETDRVRSAFARRDWQGMDPAPPVAADPVSAAHLLFTSGSTGVPKGVVITHRNVTTFIDWAVPHFGMGPEDRVSGHPPLHFDLSTFDIYGTFAAGAELHLVPAGASVNPRALAALIRESELTQWFSVPSVLTYMAKFDAVAHGDFPALERLLWCGEVLPTPVLAHWMDRLPHVRFTNLYGPTEATIASSWHEVRERPRDEKEPIPIGRACDGEELLVLDRDLRPHAAGETGDLYIAGDGLSPGYWRDEEKTRAAFLPDPRGGGGQIYRTGDLARAALDGVFHFLGRADSQIKSRGYRIELGEVETALNAVEGIRESVVVAIEAGGFEGSAICCAYCGPGLDPPTIRKALAEALPSYMLPGRWLALDALPKNLNGKIDRAELRKLFEERGR